VKILITGSKGFIGKNLKFFLLNKNIEVNEFNRSDNKITLLKKINNSDAIIHLAGENRSNNKKDFINNNYNFTKFLIKTIRLSDSKSPLIFSSTTQIYENNIYGKTKKLSEDYIKSELAKNKINFSIIRMNNIFGKWSKPNYNSFIATCCYNLTRNKKIKLNKNKFLKLTYIDDIINIIERETKKCISKKNYYKTIKIKKYYKIKLYELYKILKKFKNNYQSIQNDIITDNLRKKLFSTFISFIPTNKIKFKIKKNIDRRGNFSEFSRIGKFGQISYFSIKPNASRGHHYHNSKIEKFLLIKGAATYVTKNLLNNKKKVIKLKADNPEIIYSIPGHVHYFKNNSSKDAIVIVWANENFSKQKPDTYRVV
tara:strand:- start:1932 stop:3038 length:1107 start_codon:yes stop_codon:yes gene_type:complete